MATSNTSIETHHEDIIHDAQFDYYGKRLATCSSDRTIRIFEVLENSHTLIAELKGHEGPVWQISFAHPKFGNILASCSYDRKVKIWKENSKNEWNTIYEYSGHEISVNSVAWAPHEYGLILASGSSDGYISILTYRENNTWEATKFEAHSVGVNAVSWAPVTAPIINSASTPGTILKRLVSGGSDNSVKIWREIDNKWKNNAEKDLLQHNDWVRDVAWAPNIGLPTSTIASCTQDGYVFVWNQDDPNGGWTSKKVGEQFSGVVWRVSWSVAGNILAVSGGDNRISLWKENVDGEWSCLSVMDDTSSS